MDFTNPNKQVSIIKEKKGVPTVIMYDGRYYTLLVSNIKPKSKNGVIL